MATPIKETPILYGKDSDRFLRDIQANEDIRVPRREYDKAMKTYHEIMDKATFK